MSWYYHVVEQHDRSWSCRHGREELDHHPDLDAAIAHVRTVGGDSDSAEYFAHFLDGEVRSV